VRGPPPRHPDEQREQLPPVEGFISDAADLAPGVRVVYPNQGVCKVVGTEEQDISGHKLQVVRMQREEDGAAVLVPRNKVPSIGLRRVATGGQIEGVFHYLAAQLLDPELDWKIRHRDNADRLVGGGILGLAEVVKGLHGLSRLRPLPTKEREQYDNARHLLVAEVAVALGVPPGLAEDHIDYALMPPTGVKFDVPPPPQPVQLPQRIRRRKPVAEEEGGLADLGLADLGLELESLDADAVVPEAAGAVKEEGAENADGAETPGAAEDGEGEEVHGRADEDDDAALPAARPAPLRAAPAERPAASAKGKPAKKATPARPKKPAAKKPEKAEKPAREKAPKKPAKAAAKAKGKKK
jgi:RNA polymerase-interacting CarD/CdnL/TRCF family regulator